MAGWSSFSNGSSLDCLGLEPVDAYHGNGGFLVKDHVDNANHHNVKQKCLFYELFPVYLKENCSRGIVRPVPVLLGDGQLLDLYKLFSLVKEKGGYAVVSKKGLWGYVTKKLGLDLQVVASVRLVYDKYLNDFDAWLRKTFEEKIFRNGNHGCNWGFKSLPFELAKEFRGLLCPTLKEKDDELAQLESKKIRKCIDFVKHKNKKSLLDAKKQKKCEDVQNAHGDDDEKLCNGGKDGLATPDADVTEKEFNSRKRKREELSGMLNWMKHIAKHPRDPLIQPIPKPSKWKENKGHDLFFLLLRAREVLSLRQCVETNVGLTSLQKQKMHPSMYEDQVALGHHSTAKLRCSERLPTSAKSRLCSCCNSCSSNGNRLTSSVNTEAEKCPPEKKTATVDILTAKIMADQSGDDFREKHVSIGPLFQAEVPEWTGVVSESDSKWLGTQVWDFEHDSKPPTETDLIGRGRQVECSCKFQGSVECVRFHIAESRMKLKHELGSAFYHWGFDRMGEEVSLQWTTEEERRFKDLVRSNNSYFWDNSAMYFADKRRKNLVSYYFNVYLIQKRSYQNRMIPAASIDSDNDEVDFGSFGDGFGMEALRVPGSNLPECSDNKQCTDLEETQLK